MNEIAASYGLALFSLSKEQDIVEKRQKEVKDLKSILKENADFITVLDSSFLTLDDRMKVIDNNFPGIDEDIKNFLKVICRNNRATFILDIFDSFNSYCNEHRGIKEGILYSTVPIAENDKNRIEEKIAQLEKCSVELTNRIDPSLVGGVKVLINSRIYDGSISGKIEKIKRSLLGKEDRFHEN